MLQRCYEKTTYNKKKANDTLAYWLFSAIIDRCAPGNFAVKSFNTTELLGTEAPSILATLQDYLTPHTSIYICFDLFELSCIIFTFLNDLL